MSVNPGYTVLKNGCWRWNGCVNWNGYPGQMKCVDGRYRAAYVANYMAATGWTPKAGWAVDHLCKNRLCINPAHLEAVTTSVNVRRAQAKLTPDKVRQIRSPDVERGDQMKLCRKFGVSPALVSQVRSGKRWKDIV